MPRYDFGDIEKEPGYEEALARYVAAQPSAPPPRLTNVTTWTATPDQAEAEAARFRAERAPASSGGAAPPMARPAAALASMAQGAGEPDRRAALALAIAKGEDLTPFITQPGPDARVMPAAFKAPSPTPEGKALLADLDATGAAQRPAPPRSVEARLLSGAGSAIASGAKGLAQMAARGVLQTTDQPERGAWYDSEPEPPESPPATPAPTPPPAARPVVAGKPPPVPPPSGRTAPERPLTDAQGQNIMAALRGPVRDITREASGLPPSGPPPSTPAPVQQASVPQAPPAAPGVDPLQAAERAASQNRLIAGLARAGGTAIGRGNARGYDVLDANAGVPLQEMEAERADAERKKGAAALALDQDPSSPQSVMARELAAQVVPGIKTAAWYPSASYATLSRGPFAKLLDMNADLQKARIDAQAKVDAVKAKHAGGAGGKGKTLPASEAAKAGDYEAAAQSLDSLMETRKAKTGPLSGVAQYLPGTDAAQYNDAALSTAQVVGYILEGGKLSDADLPRYLRMLPTAGDSAERARGKVDNIKRLLAQKRAGQLGAMGAAGYNVSGVEARAPRSASVAAAPAQTKSIGGKQYEQDEDGQWYEVDG